MSSLALLTTIGIVAVAALTWFFIRTRSADLLEEIVTKRKPSAKLATRASFVEGPNQIPVALSVTDKVLYYENPDMQAELELERIDEVEYDTELSIGRELDHGKVMRLRSHGHAFEFILEQGEVDKWSSVLPPHRGGEPHRAVV
jgi:hypothetical protein